MTNLVIACVKMNLEKLLYRIILGYYYIYVNNSTYKVVYPSAQIKYEAEILYENIIDENKFDKRWMNDKEIELYLQINNIWNKKNNEELNNVEKNLENMKVELFLNFNNENKKKLFQKNIKQINKDLDRLYALKNSYNYLHIKEHALSIKNEFIIMNSIYDTNNCLVFKNPKKDNYKHSKLQSFIKEIIDNSITIRDLRLLARSDIWRSYVNSTLLEREFAQVNDDYRHLINLHKMYENAKQHPESPSEAVIEDDDALDGWFIYENRKTEKEKKKNSILNKVGGNIKNAGEVFMLTDSTEESKDIYSLNEPESKRNIKELIHTYQTQQSPTKWQDLSFVKSDINKQIMEKSNNIRK